MTRDEAREAAKVLQHYADGGDVQCNYGGGWIGIEPPIFNFRDALYRIKPKPAEGWGTILDNNADSFLNFSSEHAARKFAAGTNGPRVIHWREVIE